MDALIAILAGGRATRLGGDKAIARLAGRPLIERPLAAARSVAEDVEIVVVAKPETALPPLGARVLLEPQRPAHPLRGIVTALREAGERPVVVLACDMPFVAPELLATLASLPEPLAMPSAGGRLHPLLARYERSLLLELEPSLGDGRPLQETVAALGPRELGEEELARFGDPQRLLFNVNTPADLELAGRMIADRDAS